MNRRQKIIVSVTGIFLVLLLLVGLTYAYFLTKISGNTNTKSISVSTANLALVYGNDNGNVIGENEVIEPNTTFDAKTFTVKNEGNATTDYAVVLENYKVMYAMTSGEQVKNATTSLAYPNDFKLKITCTSNLDEKSCNGLGDTLPTTNDILLTNSIEIGEIQSYELSLEYIDTKTDQSNDMNKTIEGKINIIDTKTTIDIEGSLSSYSTGDYVQVNSTPKVSQITSDGKYKVIGVEPGSHTIEIYSKTGTKKGTQSIEIVKGTNESVSGNTISITDDSRTVTIDINDTYETTIDEDIKGYNPYKEGTLAYNIINNAQNETNGTIYSPTPLTTPAVEMSGENEMTLSVTTDDYGTTYYYRGNVEDNYVNFAGMCWRIVRIEGDGSIKIVLADKEAECSTATQSKIGGAFIGNGDYGYKYDSNGYAVADYINSTSGMRSKFNAWLISSGIDTSKLKQNSWCIGNIRDGYSYDSTGKKTGIISDMVASGTSFRYTGGNRYFATKVPTLKCDATGDVIGEVDTNYVGALTFDEVAFAGGKDDSNQLYYLNQNAISNGWWTLTLSHFDGKEDHAFRVNSVGGIYYFNVFNGSGDYAHKSSSLRPAVSLVSSVKISNGDGTISSPYILP